MKKWFDILKITRTRDKNIIEEAYQKCIQEDSEHSQQYLIARENILKWINCEYCQELLSQLEIQILNQDLNSMGLRIEKILLSQEFQSCKNNKDFQECLALLLEGHLTKETCLLFLKEFPLKKLDKDNHLYLVIKKIRKQLYHFRVIDIIFLAFILVSVFLHLKWRMMMPAGICLLVGLFYIGMYYLCVQRDKSIGFMIMLRVIIGLGLWMTVNMNYQNVGAKLGNQSFEIKVIDKAFVSDGAKDKIVDDYLYIYQRSQNYYHVFDASLHKVAKLKMPNDFDEYNGDMIVSGNQYYYTAITDNKTLILNRYNNGKTQKILEHKISEDVFFYESQFFKEKDKYYLVSVFNHNLTVFLIKDDQYEILVNNTLDHGIEFKDMVLRDGYLFYKNSDYNSIIGYNLYTNKYDKFAYIIDGRSIIKRFIVDDFHIIFDALDNNIYIVPLPSNKDEDIKVISNIHSDSLLFFDSFRFLFGDGQNLRMYNLNKSQYENSVEIDAILSPIKKMFRFKDNIILYNDENYSAIQIITE